MNTKWHCPACKKVETTGPNVKELSHHHGGLVYPLSSARKTRKAPGTRAVKLCVWDVFSEYIRRKTADNNGLVSCVTCGKVKHWTELQAGHFISRRHSMTLFDERNVHPQCAYCNGPLHGNITAYQDFMVNTYGQETVDELWRLARLTHSFKPYELEGLLSKYKAALEALRG